MPTSTATVTTSNLELSPVRVTYNGVDLGGTLGNVVLKTEFHKADIKADQLGSETVLDRRVSGLVVQVITEIAEVNLKDNWKVVFPHAKEVTSGPNKMMYFQSAIGDSDLANSHQLILHPLSRSNGDVNGDHTFFKATATAMSEIVYGPKEQARLKITWNILPDTSVVPARWYIHGDPGIGIVHAMAGAPMFVGTGNGTMTGVLVYDGFTKTETITARLVTVSVGGGVFEVHGSLSGPLGLATVGVAFAAPEISFTINAGGIDFALNDTFTVATTAANYM